MDINKHSQEFKENLINHYFDSDFVKEYKKLFYGCDDGKDLYLLLLYKLENAIKGGDIDNFKNVIKKINCVSEIENFDSLKNYYGNSKNPVNGTNLIILICKYKNLTMLKYIFENKVILKNFTLNLGKNDIFPDDKDGDGHDAFYYAMRSGNIDLLNLLINEWPDKRFSDNFRELDSVLSRSYEELKLKNVLLSNEMEIFVETKLLNLRFYSCDNTRYKFNPVKHHFNVCQRVRLVLENISKLNKAYFQAEVDEKFVCVAKFIAENIHVLKHQLKFTYDKLPWEEVEFNLILFISSEIKVQEMNLFYHSLLTKDKILKYLIQFAGKLEEVIQDINIDSYDLTKNFNFLNRDKVVSNILRKNPDLEDLYTTYMHVRDICSLHKINEYVNLALLVNPQEKDGQLIISRVLQVIGEYLKNTLESPKLSTTSSELLLLSLPKNTRKILIDLRNSLSHAYSLDKRTEIEQLAADFFVGVQNDVKKIGDVIGEIFHKYKMDIIKSVVKEILNSNDLNGMKRAVKVLKSCELDKVLSINFQINENEKLEKLIMEISNCMPEKNETEQNTFKEIKHILNSLKMANSDIQRNYIEGFAALKSFEFTINNDTVDDYFVTGMKCRAEKVLQDISLELDPKKVEKILELLSNITRAVTLRTDPMKLDNVYRKIFKVFYHIKHESKNIKWIEKLRDNIIKSTIVVPTQKPVTMTKENYERQLKQKLAFLKNILNSNLLGKEELLNDFSSYRNNKKLQALVEMLVLDILSILECSKNCLENNVLLDDNVPVLVGKLLRNHLAHYNDLVDLFLSDPLIAVLLNANKFISENIVHCNKRIGQCVADDPMKLETEFKQDLKTIINQRHMFTAIEEGKLECFEKCLRNGADINGRNIDQWTALHFGAKGSNAEIVTFLLSQRGEANVKNVTGQNPLHIAAAYGRKNIVELLIKETNLSVNDVDHSGKSPLHIAAKNGHKSTVEVLLQNGADALASDKVDHLPVYYAVRNNFIDIVKILLQNLNRNLNTYEICGGYSLLHAAAEAGHLEIVNFLLDEGANVNAKNDRNWTPLHAAARNGYTEIVESLVLKGADINASVISGCTSLHYAAEEGHEEIVVFLLKHKVNFGVFDNKGHSPLFLSAAQGHQNIVKNLLEWKVNAKASNYVGRTPLHAAAKYGNFQIVLDLIEYGAEVNAGDDMGFLPLHYAVMEGHSKIVDILVKNKSVINAKTKQGFAPLHFAALENNEEIINILLKNHAEIDLKSKEGLTPLHLATQKNNIKIIDLLIKKKANINSKNNGGYTPLHIAVSNGHRNIVEFLIKNKAEVNCKASNNITPLHWASFHGHKDIVELLIQNKAYINSEDKETGSTPLFAAVETGHKDCVETLIQNGANINMKNKNGISPFCIAARQNYPEIVKLLYKNEIKSIVENRNVLFLSVLSGYSEILDILLEDETLIHEKEDTQNNTVLHLAAYAGQKEILEKLIAKKAFLNALNIHKETPLFIAAKAGNVEIVEILIMHKASLTIINDEGFSALHAASANGHLDVVKRLLENKEIDINLRDYEYRTAAELAVSYGHLEVVKALFETKKIDVNSKGSDGYTKLHIAAQENKLEIIEYLLMKGADICALNAKGSKPIHMASREGHIDSINFFLSKGCSVNECSIDNRTLLHFAAMKGHLQVIKYLIAEGANVNAVDDYGMKPAQFAGMFGYKHIVDFLTSFENLFNAVQHNRVTEVKNCLETGGNANTKNIKGETLLHFAAWKGHNEIVNILIENKANVNSIDNKGCMPLYYAAKHSHLKVVKTLLSGGAIYNASSDSGKTPFDVATDKRIISLLELVKESFYCVENENSKVVNTINKIKDVETVKAIMNAQNIDNKSLIVLAEDNGFSKIEELKGVLQDNVTTKIFTALAMLNGDKYDFALSMLRNIYDERKKILGANNPGTLDIQTYIAKALLTKGLQFEALHLLNNVCSKQTEVFGLNHKVTLSTRSTTAFLWYEQGKYTEALKIYEEVCLWQKKILGPDHDNTLESQLHMALVLDKLEKYEEALKLNEEVYEKREKEGHEAALLALNNIAFVLSHQEKYDKSLKIYKKVLEKKKVQYGLKHSYTLKTMHNIAGVLSNLKRENEALSLFQEVLCNRRSVLGQNHPDTLTTQFDIATVLYKQKKWNQAYKIYVENFEYWKKIWGPNHPDVQYIANAIQDIEYNLKLEGCGGIDDNKFKKNLSPYTSAGDIETITGLLSSGAKINDKDSAGCSILHHAINEGHIEKDVENILKIKSEMDDNTKQFQKDLFLAASSGDIETVTDLLRTGARINDKDPAGCTAMHHAISKGHFGVVKELFGNNADIFVVSNKGNTTLHTAASRGFKDIAEFLLQKVTSDKLKDFVNAQTFTGKNTALHVAAKADYLNIVFLLLQHGAIFNLKNEEGNMPVDLSKNPKIIQTLSLLKEVFEDIKNGCDKIFDKLKLLNQVEFEAITKARDNFGRTLLQVSITKKQPKISKKLVEMLKTNDLKVFHPDLYEFARKGDTKALENLLKNGANINNKDTAGRTLLHYAVSNERFDTVSMLLKNGADLTLITNKGNTVLHIAVSKGYKEIVNLLLHHLNSKKLNDVINAQTFIGGTSALHVAAKEGNYDLLLLLLKYGAIYNVKNKDGKTPGNLARDHNCIRILKFIEEAFVGIAIGSVAVFSQLQSLKPEEFFAVMKAHNEQKNTLTQFFFLLAEKSENASEELLKMLMEVDEDLNNEKIFKLNEYS